MVGRHNAKKGTMQFFDLFQCDKLNRHLLYVLLDELLTALFPEIDFVSIKRQKK